MKVLTAITLLLATTLATFACNLQPKFAYRTKGLAVSFANKTVGNYDQVRWNFGDGTTSTEQNPEHIYTEAGVHVFSLTVSDSNNCSTTFEGKVYVFNSHKNTTTAATNTPAISSSASIESTSKMQTENNGTVIDNNTRAKMNTANESTLISQLNNYPNPFAASTTIRFSLSESTQLYAGVYDISGKLVTVLANGVVESGQQQLVLDRDNLAAGIYLVRIETNSQVATRLIVAQ